MHDKYGIQSQICRYRLLRSYWRGGIMMANPGSDPRFAERAGLTWITLKEPSKISSCIPTEHSKAFSLPGRGKPGKQK